MAGKKTHEQQVRIIEERENTKNAGDDFDAEAHLKRSDAARKAHREGQDLKPEKTPPPGSDDRSITRGADQESRHHKPSRE